MKTSLEGKSPWYVIDNTQKEKKQAALKIPATC